MSVVAKTATQDSIKILRLNKDYVTGMETCEFTYEWTINEVEYDQKTIQSPKFSSHYSDFNDEWILEIDSTCTLIDGKTCVSMQLQPTSYNGFNDTSKLQTKYEIVVGKIAEDLYFRDLSKKIYLDISSVGPTFKDALNDEYYRNHEFKICCIIKMSKKLKNNSDVISTNIATPQLCKDWKKLLLNEKSADVTIKVGQKSFRAIKGILAVRSPVFSAMFDHEEFKENEKNEVVIEDVDEDVFEEFLHYIYTDETPNVDKMPMELLAVAEKYQVDRLKNICEDVIGETINLDNVASILLCSDIYKLQKLNKKCLKFMKKNLPAVMSNETFQVYKKKYLEVFVGFLEELLLSAKSFE